MTREAIVKISLDMEWPTITESPQESVEALH